MESSDKMWPTGGTNGKPLQYSCLKNPMNSLKRQKDMTPEGEHPGLEVFQLTTEEEWRNSSRKNEETGPKRKWHSALDVSGHQSKVWCYKEQYCIGTWNFRPMNQGKLDTVKQEKARVNINILGIHELKWTGMGEFNSNDHYTYYCVQESLRRNRMALIVNKQVWNAVSKTTEWPWFISSANHSTS